MKRKYDIAAIDAVVNLWTKEANALRPKRDAFYQGKMKVKKETAEGISLKEMLRRMDAAGIERAFLVATRAGRLGHPACYHLPYELVALNVFLAMVGIVTFGSLTGSMLPFLLRRMGFDPASASAPFVATLVDVTGLIIYFTVALVVLGKYMG